jgi:hypothetical protein
VVTGFVLNSKCLSNILTELGKGRTSHILNYFLAFSYRIINYNDGEIMKGVELKSAMKL